MMAGILEGVPAMFPFTRRSGLHFSALVPLLVAGLAVGLSQPAHADDYGSWFQIVKPNQSIQQAIDQARPGGIVAVLPGTYHESASATNGLEIGKSVHLIGLSTSKKRVVLENAGGQRNGIVAVPSEHYDCMSCHASLAPPFTLLPAAEGMVLSQEPTIYGLTVSGITIKDFTNNGLFARGVDGFSFVDVHSVGNKNYGIFPVSSRNGLITLSSAVGADDSGIWVETSQNVRVTYNRVEGNVNGFEVSNSDDVLLAHNVVRGNTIGMAILFLPDIFPVRPDARRITIRDNLIQANNKPNTAREGAILSTVAAGFGILHVGVDDSLIEHNIIEDNEFSGISIVDYCLAVSGGPFDCSVDPDVVANPGFVADHEASNNRVVENLLVNNGTNPDPTNPFSFTASDLGLLVLGDHGNCYAGNIFATFFSTLGVLPPCP
jgi:parallel beta-helix repeat protein